MNKQQTPLEKLISDKNRLQERCRLKEQDLNSDFTYIQENSASLLLSGITSLLFGKSKQAPASERKALYTEGNEKAEMLGLSDIISIGKGMLPVVWDIVKPILISWGMRKAGKLFTNALFKKKK